MLGCIISFENLKGCIHVMYTLYIYMTRYADISGELNEILKEILKTS